MLDWCGIGSRAQSEPGILNNFLAIIATANQLGSEAHHFPVMKTKQAIQPGSQGTAIRPTCCTGETLMP